MPCIDDFKCFLMTPWNWPCWKKHQGRGSKCSHWSNQTSSPGLFVRGGMQKMWVSMMPKSWWTCHVRRSTEEGAANAPTEATRHWVQGCSWEAACRRGDCQWCPSLDELATSEVAPRKEQWTLPPKQPDTESGVFHERQRVEGVSVNDAQVLMNWPCWKKHWGRGSENSHQSNQTLSPGLFVRGGVQRGWILVSAHVDGLKSAQSWHGQ